MGRAGDGHDPRRRRGQERRHQRRGERPVPEVVHPELHLVAVGRLPLRHRHQAGVVDQDVDLVVRAEDRLRRPSSPTPASRGRARPAPGGAGVSARISSHRPAAFSWSRTAITTCAPLAGEHLGRLQPQAAVRARDHRGLAGQVRHRVSRVGHHSPSWSNTQHHIRRARPRVDRRRPCRRRRQSATARRSMWHPRPARPPRSASAGLSNAARSSAGSRNIRQDLSASRATRAGAQRPSLDGLVDSISASAALRAAVGMCGELYTD